MSQKNRFEVTGKVTDIYKDMVNFGKGPTPHLVVTVLPEGEYAKPVAAHVWGEDAKALTNITVDTMVRVSGQMKSTKRIGNTRDGEQRPFWNTSLSAKDVAVLDSNFAAPPLPAEIQPQEIPLDDLPF